MYDFLISHIIIYEHQFGFQKNKSTALAVLDIYSTLIKSIQNKESLQLQSPYSVDLNNKRTTSQKGGKDWALVNFSVKNQHNSHETHGKGNS